MTIFNQLHKTVLSEDIVSNIVDMIRDGRINPGDKMPPERELAKIMNVSRPSLREALRALSLMNIIDIKQGDGTYISTLKPELLVEHLELIFSIDNTTFLQLFEARKVIEVACAGFAAERITEDDIEPLNNVLNQTLDRVAKNKKFSNADLELHAKIGEISRNFILSRFLASIQRLTRESRYRTSQISGVRQQAARDHKEIINAIIYRKPQEARDAMLRHLNYVESKFQEAFIDHNSPNNLNIFSQEE